MLPRKKSRGELFSLEPIQTGNGFKLGAGFIQLSSLKKRVLGQLMFGVTKICLRCQGYLGTSFKHLSNRLNVNMTKTSRRHNRPYKQEEEDTVLSMTCSSCSVKFDLPTSEEQCSSGRTHRHDIHIRHYPHPHPPLLSCRESTARTEPLAAEPYSRCIDKLTAIAE